jgi:hypothetical protein
VTAASSRSRRRAACAEPLFTVVVDYSGIPESLEGAGFIHTDDGTLVAGEPHSQRAGSR